MAKWWAYGRLARPLQVLAVAVVAATGMSMAVAQGSQPTAAALLWQGVALLLVSVSIHYANEYADAATDALTTRTPFSGGSGVLAAGRVQRGHVLLGAWGLLSAGLALYGLVLLRGLGSPVGLAILLTGAFWGWMYSLPPLRLAWRGRGEITNALLGGALLLWYGEASASGRISLQVLAYGTPFTLLVFLNLLATTWADRDADGRVGKNTLAVRLAIPQLRRIFLSGALLYALCLPLLLPAPLILLLHLPALPLLAYSYRCYTRLRSPHPMVYTMIVTLVGQAAGWLLLAASA